ncbi:MAG: hypothetical protein KGH60_00905 [Candidatus Micrarchaeota archaeon]|nr:hypothetical protein [Candidatus Micrarchaeota archaeon]
MGKAQSAMEYLVTYGWAILIIAIVVSLLYLYVIVPSTVVPSTCSFVSGAYCNNIIVGTNLQTHVTKLAVFLTNTQSYPLANPALIVRTGNVNSTPYACSPTFVLAGGSVVCTVTLPVQSSLSQFLAGSFYLTGTYCGLSSNYSVTHKCTGQVQTYTGSFTSHVQPLINTNNIVLFTAQNATNPANNAKDPLRATVLLLGYPLRGATVNFTENVLSYKLQPNLTTTNTTGIALSYIWGTRTGNVVVNAVYAGITNSLTIQFTSPTSISFSTSGFAYCSQDTSTMVVFDGIAYTCSQWISTPLACGIGSSHTYNFSRTVSISSSIREIFNKVIVNGVSSTSNHSTIICPSANESIIANYTTQFYLTETSNPSGGAATLTPGSNWYDNGSIETLSEANSIGYFFNTWSCTGTGCYSGSSTSTTLPINAVIGETANYYSTSTTSTTSTSTTSTTTSTSTTSTSTSTSTTTIPANPTCGPNGGTTAFAGSITYTSSVTLTCNVITSSDINVNSGVTINENGFYMQANRTFTTAGTITDTSAGGAGGAGGPNSVWPGGNGGSAGASGKSRTSRYLSQSLSGGTGGAGGSSGSQGCETTYTDGCYGGLEPGEGGGTGGPGGGIVEIYAGNFTNTGTITAAGNTGGNGTNGANGYITSCSYPGPNTSSSGGGGAGGAGAGGAGGTILIGYTHSLTLGTTNVAVGASGSGGSASSGVNAAGGCAGQPASSTHAGTGGAGCDSSCNNWVGTGSGTASTGGGTAGQVITKNTWTP